MDELVNEKTIVLHPGSLHLRIGTESPVTSLHCIARRRKPGGGIYNEIESIQEGWTAGQKHAVNSLYKALRSKRTGWEGGKTSNSGSEQSQDVLNINLVNHVEIYDEPAQQPSHQDVIVGDATLKCDLSQYNLHFPYKGGELNLHPGIGGSLTSVLSDLSIIWSNAISQGVGIDPSEFPDYKIILLIPSVYKRNHIKHLMHLLLSQLNFKAAFPLQEDVAATFGTGHAVACVVDLGHMKTSISCVEDAISLTKTRIKLDYGSSLISDVFHQLSVENGYPYRRDYSSLPDYILTQNIKETKCNLNIESSCLSHHSFTVTKQSSPPQVGAQENQLIFAGNQHVQSVHSFSLAAGDECVISSMSLFQEELMDFGGSKYLTVMQQDPGDPEDPSDESYLTYTSRRYNKIGEIQVGEEQEFEDTDPLDQGSVEIGVEPAIPLDQAILRSINSIQSEDLRRKMLVNILLIGGGSNLSGLTEYLQNKLNSQVVGGVEILKDTKECGVGNVSWKGGYILASMETAQELWIGGEEWRRTGVKVLRERSLFSWQ